MYVSLQSLGIFLGLLVVLAVGIYLIITLNSINKVVVLVGKHIKNNESNIQDTITNVTNTMKKLNEVSTSVYRQKELIDVQIPGTINNIHSLSATLKRTGEKVDHSVDKVNTSLMETASTVQENTEDILGYVRIVSEGLRILLEIFSKK